MQVCSRFLQRLNAFSKASAIFIDTSKQASLFALNSGRKLLKSYQMDSEGLEPPKPSRALDLQSSAIATLPTAQKDKKHREICMVATGIEPVTLCLKGTRSAY